MHALMAGHRRAHARRVRRVGGRREEFEVAVFQHHAYVRRPGRAVLRLLVRARRDAKPERLQRLARRAQVANEVRNVVEKQLARRGALACRG